MQSSQETQEQRSGKKLEVGLEGKAGSEMPKDRSPQSRDWHGSEEKSPSKRSQPLEGMQSAKKHRTDMNFEDIEANARNARGVVLPPLSRQ
jgi:hypothetical protein